MGITIGITGMTIGIMGITTGVAGITAGITGNNRNNLALSSAGIIPRSLQNSLPTLGAFPELPGQNSWQESSSQTPRAEFLEGILFPNSQGRIPSRNDSLWPEFPSRMFTLPAALEDPQEPFPISWGRIPAGNGSLWLEFLLEHSLCPEFPWEYSLCPEFPLEHSLCSEFPWEHSLCPQLLKMLKSLSRSPGAEFLLGMAPRARNSRWNTPSARNSHGNAPCARNSRGNTHSARSS